MPRQPNAPKPAYVPLPAYDLPVNASVALAYGLVRPIVESQSVGGANGELLRQVEAALRLHANPERTPSFDS